MKVFELGSMPFQLYFVPKQYVKIKSTSSLPIPPVMLDFTVGGTGVNPVWNRATVAVYWVLFKRSEEVGGSTTPFPVTAGAKAGMGT